jgi:YbbR domain-containing protein
MSSNVARITVVVVAIAAAVVLFVALSGDDEETPTTTAATTTTTQEPTGSGAEEKPDKPKPKPEPEVATIAVKGGQPVGGVQELTFTAGEDIRFVVESDEAAEIHFHGYDIAQDVEAGGKVEFDVKASIEGVFEVEVEETAVHIAEISVTPG